MMMRELKKRVHEGKGRRNRVDRREDRTGERRWEG